MIFFSASLHWVDHFERDLAKTFFNFEYITTSVKNISSNNQMEKVRS